MSAQLQERVVLSEPSLDACEYRLIRADASNVYARRIFASWCMLLSSAVVGMSVMVFAWVLVGSLYDYMPEASIVQTGIIAAPIAIMMLWLSVRFDRSTDRRVAHNKSVAT